MCCLWSWAFCVTNRGAGVAFSCLSRLNCRYNRFILEERRKTQAEKFARKQRRREKKLKKLRKQEASVESADTEVSVIFSRGSLHFLFPPASELLLLHCQLPPLFFHQIQ